MYENKRIETLVKSKRPLISPSLLAADFADLRSELAKVESADSLHLDIMDGHFVPNISYGPGIVKQLRPLWDKAFDVHLMVDHPEDWIEAFVDAGADAITFHWEATAHHHRLCQQIHQAGCLAGVSMTPSMPVELLSPLLPFVDQVLLMTVNPGFGGQDYIAECEAKMSKLRAMIMESGRDILLQIDGGVKAATIAGAAKAGADYFVAGTAVFKAEDPSVEIANLRRLAEEAY